MRFIRSRRNSHPALLVGGGGGGGGGGGYVGPADVNGTPFIFGGLRALNAAYASATSPLIDIVDQAGGNPTTIHCVSGGGFDDTAYNSWVSAHSVTTTYIVKMYDQVGTNHWTQGTYTSGAKLVTSPVTGLRAILIPSGNYIATGGITITDDFSWSAIFNRHSGIGNARIFQNGNSGFGLGTGLHTTALNLGSSIIGGPMSYGVQRSVQARSLGSGTPTFYQADTSYSGTSGSGGFSSEPFYIWSNVADDFEFLELGLWSGNKTANDAAMVANQRSFYGDLSRIINPLVCSSNLTLSGGNLTATRASSGYDGAMATPWATTGNLYFEATINHVATDVSVGVVDANWASSGLAIGVGDNEAIGYSATGNVWWDSSNTAVMTATDGDVIGIALRVSDLSFFVRRIRSGVASNWNNNPSADPTTNTGGVSVPGSMTTYGKPWMPALALQDSGSSVTMNFGATSYALSAPSGFSNWTCKL